MKGIRLLTSLCLLLLCSNVGASDSDTDQDPFKTPTKSVASLSSAATVGTSTPYTPNSSEVIDLLNITLDDFKAEGRSFTNEQTAEYKKISLQKFKDLISAINKGDEQKIRNEIIFLIGSDIETLGERDKLLAEIEDLKNKLQKAQSIDESGIVASSSSSINYDPETLTENSALLKNREVNSATLAKDSNWDYLKIFIKSAGAGLGAVAGVFLGIFLITHFSK